MMKKEAGARIEEMLCQLADATCIDGEIWRAAYTLEDKIAKNILREWIEDLGLEYREDAIGNVYGRLPGTEPGTVLTGSHLDTVKNGGKYDGALGVVTGVAALGYLKQSGFVPKHSLEVVGLMEEEGSRFPSGCQGSRAICGTLKEEDLEEVGRDGVTLREALLSAGYQPEALKSVKRDDIRAIVELHIEQGPVLESEQKQIGIVDSIVGIVNYELTIQGSQNHAELYLTIREGKFHQVKRMMEAVGTPVIYLKRISMGPLTLPDDLKKGECRELTEAEIQALKER